MIFYAQDEHISGLCDLILEWSAQEPSPFEDEHAPSKHASGYLSKSKEKDGGRTATRHHDGLPSLPLATRLTDEGWLKEQTTAYLEQTVKPRFEASEQRDARATELVQLVNAAGALALSADDVIPMEEAMLSEAIERHRQEEAEADALQARFVDAYQRGERRELLLQYGQAALAARETEMAFR